MNIYDDAIQMEKDGEKFYRELAAKCPEKGLAAILTLLADAEVSHISVFEQMKARCAPRVPRCTVLTDTKNIFVRMKEAGENPAAGASQVDLLRKAQKIEQDTRRVYMTRVEQVPEAAQKEIFRKIAAEEQKHATILGNMIEMVSRPDPGNWLENAEWHHLEEY